MPIATDGSINTDALIKQLAQERTQLANEDSLQGELWRWQKANRKQIEKICAEPEMAARIDSSSLVLASVC